MHNIKSCLIILILLFQLFIVSSAAQSISLQPGDIVWRDIDEDYFKVPDFLQHRFAHPLMYIGKNSEDYLFIEAHNEGVELQLYGESWINENLYNEISRVKASLTQKQNAIAFMYSQVGKDFRPVFIEGWHPKVYDPTVNDEWFCTELVWAAYYNCNNHPNAKIFGDGIDIDRKGGTFIDKIWPIVLPNDIRMDNNVINLQLFI